MNEPAATYPCPACRTEANLATGCPGCGRAPDPEAAEATRLTIEIEGLAVEAETARQHYADLVARLNSLRQRRDQLAAGIRARLAAEQAAAARTPAPKHAAPARTRAPEQAAAEPAAAARTPAAARPETSGRTVQNVLYVLGGLLLASAAIVFTAVAWARFGVGGRAAILGAVTVLTLAVPPVAIRRRLTGTAETFAALGLLLVLLDGYASWYVNLAGVADSVTPSAYAGLVFGLTAVVGLGYGLTTHLVGPRFVALVAAQPVLPLLLARAGLGAAGWTAVFGALAAADLTVTRLVTRLPLRVLAGFLAGAAFVTGSTIALGALVTADRTLPAVRTGLAITALACVLVAAGLATGVAVLRHIANGAATLAVLTAGARVTLAAYEDLAFMLVAAEITALSAVVRALPVRVRPGPRYGALTAAAVTGLAALVWTLVISVMTVGHALPAWHATLRATADRPEWRLLTAIALLGLAFGLLLPRAAARYCALTGLAAGALAVPGSVPLVWWAPSIVDFLVVAPLAAAALMTRSARRSVVYGGVAGLLAAHAVLAGLARPASTAGVLAALVVLAAGMATTTGMATTGMAAAGRGSAGRPVGAAAAGVLVLALPPLAAAVAATAGSGVPVRFAGAGLVLAFAVTFGLRRWYPSVPPVAVPLAGTGVTIAALAAAGEPFGVYAALALAGAAITVAHREARAALPVAGALAVLPAVLAVVAVAPAVATLVVGPYRWVGRIWSGTPAGIGLVAPGTAGAPAHGPYAFGPAAVSLALLALTLGTVRGVRLWSAVPAAPALLAAAAAAHAPWPTLPALSLALGLGAALAGALRWPSPALTVVTVAAGGAGLAGALASRPATLAALGATLVTAAVCGAAGRLAAVREAGWLVAVASAAGLAFAAARAAELTLPWAALWVLAAAAAALGVSAALFQRARLAEAHLVETAAHASALVALLLTVDAIRFTATVCALWGVAVGLRALLDHRRERALAAIGIELVAYWLLLFAGNVALLEAYTLPAAGAALVAGWLVARARPEVHSWTAYGAALLAGFGPSLITLVNGPGEPLRRLALGVAAMLVVVAGSVRRRQAPVVVGGSALVLLAVHESVLLWDLVPRWIPLGAAGMLLVGLAMTYERRRRDVGRLRAAVARMG